MNKRRHLRIVEPACSKSESVFAVTKCGEKDSNPRGTVLKFHTAFTQRNILRDGDDTRRNVAYNSGPMKQRSFVFSISVMRG
jgi:hypothetical protein